MFLPSWYNFYEHYECRGTSLIGAANLSPVTNLVAGTGAVSRYKLSRSQKAVKVYLNLITSRCACPGASGITYLSWVLELSKNRDKQLTHIVRVMGYAKIFVMVSNNNYKWYLDNIDYIKLLD